MNEPVDFSRLTQRERDVLDAMVATDGTNRAIAERLGVAASTIAVHLNIIMRMTGVHTRTQLAVAWSKETVAS